MSKRLRKCMGGLITLLSAAMLGGCAAGAKAPPTWRGLASIGDQAGPRFVVYGNIGSMLRAHDTTPALDEFLYGPSEPRDMLLRNPQAAVLSGSRLLVCDQGRPAIVSLDLLNGQSAIWEDPDHSPKCPVGIAVDGTGNIYVADTTLRVVLVYNATGGFIEQLAFSAAPQAAFRPCSLAVRGQVLYVGDLANRCVDRYDIAARQWLTPIRSPADKPGLRAPTGLTFMPDDTLLIVDTIRARVFRVSAQGEWLDPLGRPGRQNGEFVRPKQVVCTPSGLICVSDAGRQSVLVFSQDGEYLMELHEQENGWRGFTLPAGLLSVRGDALPLATGAIGSAPEPLPSDWLIAADALSGSPLVLIGVYGAAGGMR